MTRIVTTIADWRELRVGMQEEIGFVPTMGNLHDGHLSLLKRAKNDNAVTVTSIFVNPTQFNNEEDFKRYPSTLDADIDKLQQLQVDYVFVPTYLELYPDNYEVQVHETLLSQELEGCFRPGHFDGMLTVVLKLFNIIMPKRVYVGEKDYQQFLLIKKMITSFFLPIELIACETVRSKEKLALSSRNSRLNAVQHEKANYFAELLSSSHSSADVVGLLQQIGIRVDYIEEKWGRRLGAIWVDDVRLIDNVKR